MYLVKIYDPHLAVEFCALVQKRIYSSEIYQLIETLCFEEFELNGFIRCIYNGKTIKLLTKDKSYSCIKGLNSIKILSVNDQFNYFNLCIRKDPIPMEDILFTLKEAKCFSVYGLTSKVLGDCSEFV